MTLDQGDLEALERILKGQVLGSMEYHANLICERIDATERHLRDRMAAVEDKVSDVGEAVDRFASE